MLKKNKGRAFISFLIVVSTIISVVVDWNESHSFNKSWHGHAVFHGLLFLNLLISTAFVSLWLIWRKSKEEIFNVRLAVILHCTYRFSFFYLGFIVNNTDPMPDHREVVHLAGFHLYPNVIASGIIIISLFVGYRIYRSEQKIA